MPKNYYSNFLLAFRIHLFIHTAFAHFAFILHKYTDTNDKRRGYIISVIWHICNTAARERKWSWNDNFWRWHSQDLTAGLLTAAARRVAYCTVVAVAGNVGDTSDARDSGAGAVDTGDGGRGGGDGDDGGRDGDGSWVVPSSCHHLFLYKMSYFDIQKIFFLCISFIYLLIFNCQTRH